jgi:hypothetical protein
MPTTEKPKDAPRSRVRKNLPRPNRWQCTRCDTWNTATDLHCHTCGS